MTSLVEKSCSGYDLARRFDKSIGFFWHATHQQIYRELARMETQGWIASKPASDGGKTRKRVYSVLATGKQELKRWAKEPTLPMDLRDELLVRMRAEAVMGPLGLKSDIERRLALHTARMNAYRDIEQRDFPPGQAATRAVEIQHLILKAGMMYEHSWAQWCTEALVVLESSEVVLKRSKGGSRHG